jgi:hypothetical protein
MEAQHLDNEGDEPEDGEEDNVPMMIKRTLYIEKTIRYVTTYEARDEEEAESIEKQIEEGTDFSMYRILGTTTWTEEDSSLFFD